MTSQIIARAAFEIIRRSFADISASERKTFRVKNLTHQECLNLLSVWEEKAGESGLGDVQIVVASDAGDAFPQMYRADPSRSITYYRNNNSGGLVYVETKVESDEQGLKNLFTLHDSNYLDGTFDEADFRVPAYIVSQALRLTGSQYASSQLLTDRLLNVLEYLDREGAVVPVRRFLQFVKSVCREYVAQAVALDGREVEALIGKELVELGLFPDEYWRETEAKAPRRLRLNMLRAELASSTTSDYDQEALARSADSTVFRDRSGADLSQEEQQDWQSLCIKYCNSPTEERRRRIPYWIFEQIFEKDVKGLKLGDRVREEIAARSSQRAIEFDRLGVIEGLNRRQRDDAQRFLDAQPPDSAPPLRDLLTAQTRKMVERVARPQVRTIFNPLIHLARCAIAFDMQREGSERQVAVRIRLARSNSESNPSIALFAFLFGSALESLAREAGDAGAGLLKADTALVTQSPPPPVQNTTDTDADADGDEEDILAWEGVDLEFLLVDAKSDEVIETQPPVRWEPPNLRFLALFWISVCGQDAPSPDQILSAPDDIAIDEWLDGVLLRKTELKSDSSGTTLPTSAHSDGFLAELIDLRKEIRSRMAEQGLDAGSLNDAFDRWSSLLAAARTESVPDGKDHPALEPFLHLDHIKRFGAADRLMMLPSHPLRLRWIAAYLREAEKLASAALAGTLQLNTYNPDYYLDWIESLSPHQQPAIHVSSGEHQFLFADGEHGWSETFSPLASRPSQAVAGQSDAAIVEEISRQVERYLHAHPFKREGLSAAMILSDATDLPVEFVRRIRSGEFATVPLKLFVVSPKAAWSELRRLFDEIDDASRILLNSAYFPSLELEFIDLDRTIAPEELLSEIACDIGIIPEFLKDGVTTQENTEKTISEAGQFNPLLARPTYVYGGAGGADISVSLRPRPSDDVSNSWSTLVVRHKRSRPVAPNAPENTDFVDLRVNFANNSRFFAALHERSHWVITVERHISRQQIEALPTRPDIVTIRDRVGTGGLYTLVVSSNSGRLLMISRLERKLERIIRQELKQVPREDIKQVAQRLYDDTRTVAPRLMLEALGISRVTEEILGLAVSRRFLREMYPLAGDELVVAWLSLDDHPEWFGGVAAIRADMARLALSRREGRLKVDVVVLESKLRRVGFDAHGMEQARTALSLLEEVLSTSPDQEAIDVRLWRERLLEALENAGPGAFEVPAAAARPARHVVSDDIRHEFIDGQFDVARLEALYSICLYGSQEQTTIERWREDPRVTIVRSYAEAVSNIGGAPAPPAGSSAPDVGSPGGPPETGERDPHSFNSDKLVSPAQPEAQDPRGVPSPPKPAPASVSSSSLQGDVAPAPRRTPNLKADRMFVTSEAGKVSEAELRSRYQSILEAYETLGIRVQKSEEGVPSALEGPASILYRLRPAPGVEPRRIIEKSDTLKLTLRLSEEHELRFSIDEGHIAIEVPKNDVDRYYVDAEQMWGRWQRPEKGLSTPLGEDALGAIIDLTFSSSNSPHLLIGGTTGSGKSEALNTILGGLIRYYSATELRFLLIDPKSTELQHLSNDPHLEGEIGWEDQDAIALLEKAVAEMQRRYEQFRLAKVRSLEQFNAEKPESERIPWWLVVLDEYADLTSDPDAKKQIEASLKRLAQKARAAGIHVIIATQKPSGEVISTNLRSNLPAQLALRVKSATESRVIMDMPGAETLAGRGDAFLKSEGRLVRIQCAKVG